MDKKHIDSFTIGTIIFPEIVEEAEVTSRENRYRPSKIGECKVEVYSGEGSIPHFHIFTLDKKFNCCVRIYDAHFFSHGNKYRDTLNSTQCEELEKWLKENNTKVSPVTSNWNTIKNMWELANPDCRFPKNKKVTEQPDYSRMGSFRDEI